MFDLERTCPICGMKMIYRPNQLWTGMRYETNVHEWYCYGSVDSGVDMHTLKLYTPATSEFKEWEKMQHE